MGNHLITLHTRTWKHLDSPLLMCSADFSYGFWMLGEIQAPECFAHSSRSCLAIRRMHTLRDEIARRAFAHHCRPWSDVGHRGTLKSARVCEVVGFQKLMCSYLDGQQSHHQRRQPAARCPECSARYTFDPSLRTVLQGPQCRFSATPLSSGPSSFDLHHRKGSDDRLRQCSGQSGTESHIHIA